MDIIRPDAYKNVIPHIKLSTYDIRKQIRGHKLEFNKTKNDFVEWHLNLPIFARPFYTYVYINNKIPTQEEFFNYYLKQNAEYFRGNSFSQDILDKIKARVFRAMPSLVRDLYFNKYVSENIRGYNVLYNLELDVENDIDLLLYNDKHIYGINLYTDTKRAHKGRRLKEHRHKHFNNITYIDLPVEFRTSYKVGDYFLYGRQEYNKLLNLIEI